MSVSWKPLPLDSTINTTNISLAIEFLSPDQPMHDGDEGFPDDERLIQSVTTRVNKWLEKKNLKKPLKPTKAIKILIKQYKKYLPSFKSGYIKLMIIVFDDILDISLSEIDISQLVPFEIGSAQNISYCVLEDFCPGSNSWAEIEKKAKENISKVRCYREEEGGKEWVKCLNQEFFDLVNEQQKRLQELKGNEKKMEEEKEKKPDNKVSSSLKDDQNNSMLKKPFPHI